MVLPEPVDQHAGQSGGWPRVDHPPRQLEPAASRSRSGRIRAAQNLQEPAGDDLAQVFVTASDVDMLVLAGPVGDRQRQRRVGNPLPRSRALRRWPPPADRPAASCAAIPQIRDRPRPDRLQRRDRPRVPDLGHRRLAAAVRAGSTSGSRRPRCSHGRRRSVRVGPSKSTVPPSLISR